MAKIVIDARELNATGTGTYLRHLLTELQAIDQKNNYSILLKPNDLDSLKLSNRKFQKVVCGYKEFTFAEQLGLWRQLHTLKPDLVHFAMVQQPVLYRGKVITTMHDLTTTRFRNPAKNWLVFTIKQQIYKFVNYFAAHKSAIVLAPSEFTKDDVARFARINSRKVIVTYEAADSINDTAKPIAELEGKEFIMYVGRPQPHKNLDRLIDAFGLLRQAHPGLRLVIAGKKDAATKQIEKRTDKKGIRNIIFTGYVDTGELRWLYENTAAYVFPSLAEGFGLPGLEAMAHGAPVVSSNATCLPEVYKDAATYFDPLDTAEMAESIGQIIGDTSLRKHLIKRGKAVAGSYSWRRMAEQTLAAYKEILGQE
jgi:glycosyltransferase involved in cell wall biosynthesis